MFYKLLFSVVICLRAFGTDSQQNFRCNDGSVIPLENFCDGVSECLDRSDEMTVEDPTMPDFSFRCNLTFPDRSCLIHPDYICNQSVECHMNAPCEIGCPSHYPCESGYRTCVSRTTLCNGDSCNSCSLEDEWLDGIGFKCVRQGRSCKLPQHLLWDGVQDCDNGVDLCFDSEFGANDGRNLSMLGYALTFNKERCFQCLDGSMIIPKADVCNGIFDCSDLSDECLCEFNVPDLCMDIRYSISVSNFTTPPGLDQCKVGQVSCGDGNCLNRTSVCDTVPDCFDGRDERAKYCGITLDCTQGTYQQVNATCRCDVFCTPNTFATLCNGIRECHPPNSRVMFHALDECHESCTNVTGFFETCDRQGFSAVGNPLSFLSCEFGDYSGSADFYTNEDECDGVIHCASNGVDEVNCTERFYCQAGNLINIANERVCDGVLDCDDQQSDEDVNVCTDRFYCPSLGGQQISINRELVCDFQINCDDSSDEMNCSTADRFYCESGDPLFVPRRAVFDGRADCSDDSDECPFSTESRRSDNVLSSRFELIGNPVLRALVWIMALLATIGNIAVIVHESRHLASTRHKAGSLDLKANHMFVLNLAAADLLMGFYLFILGIATAYYSGIYCVNSLQWLSSVTCSAMGVLVTLSSEASVLTLLFLTLYRLKTVLQPMHAGPGKWYAVWGILLSWFIASLIAFLPLSSYLQHIYVERAFFEDNIFNQQAMVTFENYKSYLTRLITLDPKFASLTEDQLTMINQASSWKNLQDLSFFDNMDTGLDSALYFGFYSANSVCIPQLFVTTDDNSHLPSIIVNSFNFISFIIVATCYVVIYFKSKSKLVRKTSRKNKENGGLSKIEKKIVRLVATDFLCWVPISILAFVSFSGYAISDIAYAISAIVLLPINSALNPILYSDTLEKIYAFIKKKFTKGGDKASESGSSEGKNTSNQRLKHQATEVTHQKVSESRL